MKIYRILLSFFIVVFPIAAEAHDARPLFIEIDEVSKNKVRLAWQTPPSVEVIHAPRIAKIHRQMW